MTQDGVVTKYTYCDNNPTIRADDEGDFWHIIIGAVGGAGKGSKHLTKLGGQVLNRTTSTASHQGFKAATKELSKASKYYIKSTWKLYYKPFFRGLGRDVIQSLSVSIVTTDGMKSLYKEVMLY